MMSPEGNSYGAGTPLNAPDLLQSAIPREQMEYYPDILVDEWAAQHIIDNELGLDSLMAVELRNVLGAMIEQSLPATLVYERPSIAALTDFVAAELQVVDEALGLARPADQDDSPHPIWPRCSSP